MSNLAPSASPPVIATVRIAAAPDVVFPYFTDPSLARKWIAESAELDARPGGMMHLMVSGNPARGVFVEVDPPRRLVFTWGIDGNEALPPGASTVEVVLEPDADGTVVTLTHRDLPADYRPSHESGWNGYLAGLAQLLGGAPAR